MNSIGPGGRTALAEAVSRGSIKMIQYLLSQNADMEKPCPAYKDATPITVAVISQQYRAADILIKVNGTPC